MQYLFRDVAYDGKTIRFIKALNFDSDGLELGPVDELHAVSRSIEAEEPDTLVVMMIGRSDTSTSRSDTSKRKILDAFWNSYRRLPDDYYEWELGTSDK